MFPINNGSKYLSNDPKLLIGMSAVIFLFIIIAVFITNGDYQYAIVLFFIFIIFLIAILFISVKKGNIQKNKIVRSSLILVFAFSLFFGLVLVTLGIISLYPPIYFVVLVISGTSSSYPPSPYPPISVLIGILLIITSEIIRRKAHITKQEIWGVPKDNKKKVESSKH
ncbi:MAG: hypothetical protein ACP5M9_00970 [Candidatus Micrarchaeia archaeon]